MTSNALPPSRQVGLIRRLAAIVYDSLLLFAVLFIASVPVTVPFEITVDHPLYPLYVIYIYAVGFGFFGWFWTHGGQTLGMKTWGIAVEDFEGGKLTWKRALQRYVAAFVSWLALGIGFLWSLIHPERLAWHDLLSKTRLRRVRVKGSVNPPQGEQAEAEEHEER